MEEVALFATKGGKRPGGGAQSAPIAGIADIADIARDRVIRASAGEPIR
jgi:hypothetical protein